MKEKNTTYIYYIFSISSRKVFKAVVNSAETLGVEKGIVNLKSRCSNLIRLLQTYKKLKMSDREKEMKKKTTLRNLVFTQ